MRPKEQEILNFIQKNERFPSLNARNGEERELANLLTLPTQCYCKEFQEELTDLKNKLKPRTINDIVK